MISHGILEDLPTIIWTGLIFPTTSNTSNLGQKVLGLTLTYNECDKVSSGVRYVMRIIIFEFHFTFFTSNVFLKM